MGIVAVAFGAKIDPAVEDDVARGIEGIRENENRGVVGGRVGLAAERERLRVPREGELAGGEELREDFVGGGVAPEYQVFGGEVGVGERGVGDDGGVAAEDIAPEVAGGGEFVFDPGAELGVERFAGGADEDEGLEKSVGDGTGEAGGFTRAGGGGGSESPFAVRFFEATAEAGVGVAQLLAVDDDAATGSQDVEFADVLRCEGDAGPGGAAGAHIGALPVFFQTLNADPRRFRVT